MLFAAAGQVLILITRWDYVRTHFTATYCDTFFGKNIILGKNCEFLRFWNIWFGFIFGQDKPTNKLDPIWCGGIQFILSKWRKCSTDPVGAIIAAKYLGIVA